MVAETSVALERPVGADAAPRPLRPAAPAEEVRVVGAARDGHPHRLRPAGRDDVDDGADGGVPPQRRGPAAEHLDALDSPERDELPVHDARLDVVDRAAVDQEEDVLRLAAAVEAADGRGRRRPGPVAVQESEAGREAEGVGEVQERLPLDLRLGDDAHSGGGAVGLDGHALGRDHHLTERAPVKSIGGNLRQREGREQEEDEKGGGVA